MTPAPALPRQTRRALHFGRELPPAPDQAQRSFFRGALGVAPARQDVTAFASAHGLDADATAWLTLCVVELISNAVRHGAGEGTLALWSDGEHLVCEVYDRGRLRMPAAQRLAPVLQVREGHGLWLVEQFCDRLQMRSTRAGTTVRIRMRLGRDGSIPRQR